MTSETQRRERLRADLANVQRLVDGTMPVPPPITDAYPYALGMLMQAVKIYLEES
jgi:hypothetical protein